VVAPSPAAFGFYLAYAGATTDTSEMGGCFFGKEKSGKPKVTGIKNPAKWPDSFEVTTG
jgi:hypothetical protein